MKVDEIRERFLKFFEQRGHTIYPSDSLIPANDPTLLFTGAGMNQFKEEFLGKVKGSRRVATCQKCLRTADLEKVGHTPDHHTFFEMLGNFSFGDYFKKEAILWAWEFLTEDLGLKDKDLWVSVYKNDAEAYEVWRKLIKVPSEKILILGEKENFWPSNAPSNGPNGPCGPCSEIFYGGPDGVEVWNLVFTQFDRLDGGRLEPLPNKNIDTGMGLERIARVMQHKPTNFEIDSFAYIVRAIEELLYKERVVRDISKSKDPKKIDAISDHIRAVTFAIGDGVLPSNEERGYVIRKLIRKAFWYGLSVGIEKPFLYKIVPIVIKVMERPYPELTKQREDISEVVLREEKRFQNTIREGLERLITMIDSLHSSGVLPAESIFKLYDTYGFPLELTQEIASEKKINVDIEGFERLMDEQRAKSKKGSQIKDAVFESIPMEDSITLEVARSKTPFEDKEKIDTEVLGIIVGSSVKEEVRYGEKAFVILKKTNFYGEKGGQVGDTGVLIKNGLEVADVTNAIDVAGRIQHEIKMKVESLKKGDFVVAKIDLKRRDRIRKNHTATHLLHSALRHVLGPHVRQSGSLVAPDRLRFDFTHFASLTDEELSRVENLVNDCIKKNSRVEIKDTDFDKAKKEGAIALFSEKYQDVVRMVSVGDYSKELCGGTHVKETGQIKLFKIISESSIASGVRRLEAVTGEDAEKKHREDVQMIEQLSCELETAPRNMVTKIEYLTKKLKKIEKELGLISDRFIKSCTEAILKNTREINGKEVVIGEIKNIDMDLLRKASDVIKGRLKKGIYVLVSEKEGKISIIVRISPSFKHGTIDALKILNDIGSSFGIKGGGRPDFAQAGTRSGVDVGTVLKKAEEVISSLVTRDS